MLRFACCIAAGCCYQQDVRYNSLCRCCCIWTLIVQSFPEQSKSTQKEQYGPSAECCLQVPASALRLMAAKLEPPTAGELGSTVAVVHIQSKEVPGLSTNLTG